MTARRPAAGGGRWIDISPERLSAWLARFDERHSVDRTVIDGETVTITAADGAFAECLVPFPPLSASDAGAHAGALVEPLVAHAARDRLVGVLLVRLGGYAAGVFDGTSLVTSKVDSRLVHGRNKAGGQSQKRFQRRREEQARTAIRAAADVATRVLVPYEERLDALVLGGDRRAIDGVRADQRLTGLFALATDRFLTAPDPKFAVLERTPHQFRAVSVRLHDPQEDTP